MNFFEVKKHSNLISLVIRQFVTNQKMNYFFKINHANLSVDLNNRCIIDRSTTNQVIYPATLVLMLLTKFVRIIAPLEDAVSASNVFLNFYENYYQIAPKNYKIWTTTENGCKLGAGTKRHKCLVWPLSLPIFYLYPICSLKWKRLIT